METRALSAALTVSSTKGKCADCNWRYEASKEDTVANTDEIRLDSIWVFVGLTKVLVLESLTGGVVMKSSSSSSVKSSKVLVLTDMASFWNMAESCGRGAHVSTSRIAGIHKKTKEEESKGLSFITKAKI